MKKKFLIALLTVTMFTCALMAGCGSENEVVEPKDDKEVVTEESNNVELSEEEQMEVASEIEEETIVDETIEAEKTISLLTALQTLDKTNGAYIYTAKMLKSDDNRIDENTLLHVFKLDITNSTATKMLTNDASAIRLKDISEMLSSMTEDNTNIFDAGLLPIYNRSNEGELETMASALLVFDYDSMSGELITYFGNKIEYVEISGVKYVMFTTDTVEEETEYSYYTLINMSDFAENAELQLPDMPDDDPNAGCINGLPSNYGGLTDCDPSVESDDIRTTYTTNDMILVE